MSKSTTTNAIANAKSKDEVLALLALGQCTVEQASAWLTAHNGNGRQNTLHCKVSEKGALSVYGLQRMPVTLYVEQWERLLAFTDTLKEFVKTHDKEFSRKGS